MLKHHYMRQEYLWRSGTVGKPCSEDSVISRTSKIDLETIPDWGTPFNLFDLIELYARKITLSQLDSGIDTQDEWNKFVDAALQLDLLVLIEDRQVGKNPIISKFAKAETSRYLGLLDKAGVTYSFKFK